MITAICPGSYDPVTFGHVDVIGRAASIFDRVVVGVVGAPQHKTPMFSLDERVAFLREALGDLDNVEVDVFSELVVEFARRWQAKAIVKPSAYNSARPPEAIAPEWSRSPKPCNANESVSSNASALAPNQRAPMKREPSLTASGVGASVACEAATKRSWMGRGRS